MVSLDPARRPPCSAARSAPASSLDAALLDDFRRWYPGFERGPGSDGTLCRLASPTLVPLSGS